MINYLVLDIENNSSEQSKKLGCKVGSPLIGDELVAIGLKNPEELVTKYIYPDVVKEFVICEKLLVGHNLGHDLLWFWHLTDLQDFFKGGGRIWDTMIVEYLVTAQQSKYASLRELAVTKYGCSEREKIMEKYWEQGINTSEIPKELVLEDVKNDVLDTEQIFLKQYEEVQKLGLMNFIEDQMDARCATIEMQYNGMNVNLETLNQNHIRLENDYQILYEKILQQTKGYWHE